jgi:large subunit ribosomal protein L32
MANPKYKHSRSRTRTRKAHDFLEVKSLSSCPNCKEVKPPHVVCPACGHYKGREVINLEEVKKKSAG